VSLEALLRVTGARGADRRFTGSHEAGSFDPDGMPVTQWLDDSVPSIEGSSWRVEIVGGGLETRSFTLADLEAFGDDVRATVECTGGWYAEQDWQGVRPDRLLGEVEGASVSVRSATGYARRFPLGAAPAMLLATKVGGQVLSAGHGFPARLVVPGRRGFWWVKWVTEIRVEDAPWWWQPPFPVT
jgi:DMSO/TMAO reductase YedYZ molybdopterin-dependent catalytic subunit